MLVIMSRGIVIFLFMICTISVENACANNAKTRLDDILEHKDYKTYIFASMPTICQPQTSLVDNSFSNTSDSCKPKWLCNHTKKKSFMDKLKQHFLDSKAQENRLEIAQASYKMMQTLEHEDTYFTYTYSLPPGIYGNNMPIEFKFQISLKIPIWRGAFWSKGSLFVGYTQTSWFQQFNYRYSNPIRDTNYKPSIFYSYPADWNLFGGRVKELRIGYLHFSNGIGGKECLRDETMQSPPECRSRSLGNRIMFEGIWEISNFGVHVTSWPYIPYRRDNPNIAEYVGYANVRLYYKHNRHFAEIHIAPIISNYARYHGSIQLGYAYSINKFFAIYGQYFYGYGNSLYEYNILSQRVGIGIRAGGF